MIRSAIAVVLCAATAMAQQQPQPQPQPQPQSNEIPKLTETMEIRVINVDVVVTDKKGVPITGLKKEDFQLYENGVPKPISNFFEVEGNKALNVAMAPPTEPKAPAVVHEETPENMKRRIILYIDNLSLAPFNRNRVFKEMKEFAKVAMRPGDEAMIATFNRSMKIRQPFTRDPAAIQSMLDSIAGESALGVANRSESRDVMKRIQDAESVDDAIATARTYSESVNHDLRNSVESLNALMSTLAGVEGKKILVLTTEGFQMSPGKEMFYLIDEIGREKGWTGSNLLESMQYDQSQAIQGIAKTANANNITMYTIHAGGLAAVSEDLSADQQKATPYIVSETAVANSTDSLRLMADMTGGLSSVNTNNYAKAFKDIERDLDSYYSLGYRAGTERVDRQRNLDVRINNKNYIVRARQTFVEKSTFAEMNDRVIANLLYKTKANDLHILVKCGTPVAQDDLFKVPVEIQIPMESLTLLPQGEAYMGGFSVYCAVANKEGDMSDVSRQSHQIRVPNAEYGHIKGKYYAYSIDMLMEPGPNRISIGVIDEVSNTTGFDRVPINAADLR